MFIYGRQPLFYAIWDTVRVRRAETKTALPQNVRAKMNIERRARFDVFVVAVARSVQGPHPKTPYDVESVT